MKKLMLTTALTAATAFGALAQTTTTEGGATADRGAAQTNVPAFLASTFTGMTLYTLDVAQTRGAAGGNGTATRDDAANARDDRRTGDSARWSDSARFLQDRDSWTSIGEIEDLVMTMDGEIRGVLLDVGGFLGMGAYTVMVGIEELNFVTEEAAPEDMDDFFVVAAMSQEQLETLPEWDADRLRSGFEARNASRADRPAQARNPDDQAAARATGADVFGDGHKMLRSEERTEGRLMDAAVYDSDGEHIGSVGDVMLGSDDRISDVLVDVGGFLGMGAHTVRLPVADARIGRSEADDSVRVQVMTTAARLRDMPAHGG